MDARAGVKDVWEMTQRLATLAAVVEPRTSRPVRLASWMIDHIAPSQSEVLTGVCLQIAASNKVP